MMKSDFLHDTMLARLEHPSFIGLGMGLGLGAAQSGGGGGGGAAYILYVAGQSNCISAGTTGSDVPAELQGVLSDIYIWRASTGQFEPYEAGVNSFPTGATGQGRWGPEAQFALRWKADRPGIPLYIVKRGVGSSALDAAARSAGVGIWDETAGELYADFKNDADTAKAALTATGKIPTSFSFIWMQGETDATNTTAATDYGTNLTSFIAAVRNDIAAAPVPFVIGRIANISAWTYRATLRQLQQSVGESLTNCGWINTDDFALAGDGIHYNPTGSVLFGNRAYEASATPYAAGAPAASGSGTIGSTRTVDTSIWTGSPFSYEYQWMRDGADISGATSSSYTIVSADVGAVLTVRTRAKNAAGWSDYEVLAANAAASWTPADWTDVIEWWDASDNATVFSDAGATTPAVADSSVAAALVGKKLGAVLSNATAGTQPDYVTDTNGKKCIDFDRTAVDRLATTNSTIVANMSGNDNAYAIIGRFKRGPAGVSTTPCAAYRTSTQTEYSRHFFGSGNTVGMQRTISGTSTIAASPTSPVSADQWYTVAWIFSGTALTVRVDGSVVANAVACDSASMTLNGFALGAIFDFAGGIWQSVSAFDGRVGELVVCEGIATNNSNIATMESYLTAKWPN